MSSLRSRNIDIRPTINNSNLNVADFKSSPGGNKVAVCDDKQFKNDENTIRINDEFDTQVMDLETQVIDFDDETQIMELSGETQVLDDDIDDCVEHMDTQLLDISDHEDCECKSDQEGAEKTEAFGDALGCIDVRLQDRSGSQTTAIGEGGTSKCHREHGGVRSESMPSENVARSSGSVKRGFASVRTASLRAAGLAARQTALKNADSGSSEHHTFDDNDGKSNTETVGGENDMANNKDEELSDGDKSNIARSLARKLFMDEDVAEMGSDDDSDRREDLSHLPSCDNDVAGLSYVDSQEPHDLSQANALEFVDRFLKVNVFESDHCVMRKSSVADIVSPDTIAKGAQSIAQQASRKSILAEASIFEWDDNLEDEGGGEFFIKKKELLYGTPKSCPKPQSSRHLELGESQSLRKLRKEKKRRNLHNDMTGFFHSDTKLVNGGKKGKVKEMDIEKEVYNCSSQQLGLDTCNQEALAAVHNAQSVDMQNVGIDTQMAAEAMEALSTVNALVNDDIGMADQGCHCERDQSRKESMKTCPSKQCSLQKRAWFSTSGVVTRSRTKRKNNTRGQSAMGQFDVGLVNSKLKNNRLSINNISAVNRRGSSDTGPMSVSGKQTKSILEGQLNINPPQPFRRRSLRGRAGTFTPVVQQAAQCIEHHPDCADDASGDSGERHCLEVVHERKRRTRNNIVSETSNQRNESLDQTTAAGCKKDGGLNCRTRDIQHTSCQGQRSWDKYTLSADRGLEITMESIAPRTRTRSRSSTTQCAEFPQEEKDLFSRRTLSSEDACQLSFKKQDASSPPSKGTLHSAIIDVSPGNMQKSSNPADITPVNLKTPKTAVSPICMGDGYHTPSCKKSLSLKKEFSSLLSSEQRCSSPFKGLRLRRDMNNVRVLFSQHLDDNIIRQQKKILSRFGVSVASSISEATHFIADKFVRTRNMLEAIANAKPVVSHLWLESCGQANCFIDEKSYILRDAKKEKELGFNMPRSLAHASRHPLLEGKRVLITPNAKPGKEIIASLVKAVHGQAVERLGRSISINDELLVISCEEDFGVCVPLLEKGITIYSSELLLNGIITQRLEYERYRLFVAHVKKTRSTLWLKKGGDQFFPVSKT